MIKKIANGQSKNKSNSEDDYYEWLIMLYLVASNFDKGSNQGTIDTVGNKKVALILRIVKEEIRAQRRGITHSMEKPKIVSNAITRVFDEKCNTINESYNKTIDSNKFQLEIYLQRFTFDLKQKQKQNKHDEKARYKIKVEYDNLPYRFKPLFDQQIVYIKRELNIKYSRIRDEEISKSTKEVSNATKNLNNQRNKELKDVRKSEKDIKEALRNQMIGPKEIKDNQSKLNALDKIMKSIADKEKDKSLQFKEINPNILSNKEIELIFEAVPIKPKLVQGNSGRRFKYCYIF